LRVGGKGDGQRRGGSRWILCVGRSGRTRKRKKGNVSCMVIGVEWDGMGEGRGRNEGTYVLGEV
jgi:hypothetical protein